MGGSSAGSWSDRDLPPGFGELAPVGSGSAGQVFRAYDEALNRTVALKLFAGQLEHDTAALAAFRHEAATLGRLSAHPGVVTVHSAGLTPSGRPWLCMQFVGGGALSKALRRDGPLSMPDALRTAALLADTLAWAHGLVPPVLHCDVKPANILLTGDGHPLLSDFGVSIWVGAGRSSVTVKGFTQAYAAPEVLFHGRFSPRSEVWSLAATLFEMLTGTPPFEQLPGEGTGAFIHRVGLGLPRDADLGLSGPLRSLLRRGLAVERDERWPTAAAFAAAIRDTQHRLGLPGTPTVPAPAPPPSHDVLVADAPPVHVSPPSAPPGSGAPVSPGPGEPASPGAGGGSPARPARGAADDDRPPPGERPPHPSQGRVPADGAGRDGSDGGRDGSDGRRDSSDGGRQTGTGPRRTVPHWWIPAAFGVLLVVTLVTLLVPRSRGPSTSSEPPLITGLVATAPSMLAGAEAPPAPTAAAPTPQAVGGGPQPPGPTAAPGRTRSALHAGQRMTPGQQLVSSNGRYVATLRSDGNLVMYPENPGPADVVWQSGTGGTNVAYATMNDVGDLRLYGADGATVYWSSGPQGSNAYLELRDDGELVICLEDGTVLWTRRSGSG